MSDTHRPTIGVLVGFQVYEGFSPNVFVGGLLRGARVAAHRRGVHLMTACGIARGNGAARTGADTGSQVTHEIRPAWPEAGPGADFVPVGPWNTDALLVVNPLRSAARDEYVTGLMARGFPVLFVGHTTKGPCLIADSENGIRQCLDHLVAHGHRRIAFIAGDEDDPGDSRIRVEAFRTGLHHHGLEEDLRLVAYGQHWVEGGHAAMVRILETGARFTAVMCSNDFSAIGAARALRERGFRIPWDVAVTGFDDHVSAAAHVPPLTSVHYPLEETGEKAVNLLADRIADPTAALPKVLRIATRLVPRHSCGCLHPAGAAPEPEPAAPRPPRQAMEQAVSAALPPSDRVLAAALCDRLLAGLEKSLHDRSPTPFEGALLEVVQEIETAEEDAHLWQAAISALAGSGPLRNSRRRTLAAELLQLSRISLSESASRRGLRLLFQNASRIEAMGQLAALLLSSRDEAEVMRILDRHLEGTGIANCHVLLFEAANGHDPTGTSVWRRADVEGADVRFPSRTFPPPELFPEGKLLDLVILPLFHQDTSLGYVAFDARDLDPLAMVVRLVSAALTTVRLHAEVLSLSLTDALTDIPNRRYFQLIMEKEVERGQRYNRDLAVIMIDIDHFKEYNDEYGHPAGDEALKEVARCIGRGSRRELDVVTRYGGEEFAVILPETSTDGARIVAEAIRTSVADCHSFRRPVTISLGVASLRGTGLTAAALLDLADRALYRAKRMGRNRSEVSAATAEA